MLNISISNIAFTIINLLVLYLFMKHFLIGPVGRILEERKEMIERDLDQAGQAREEAQQMKVRYETSLEQAKTEAAALIADARARAGEAYDKRMEQAAKDAARRIAEAERTIALERENAIMDLQAGVAGLAMTAAAKLLSEQNGPENDRNLYNRFLAESGEGND